jgi:hypothetical protein
MDRAARSMGVTRTALVEQVMTGVLNETDYQLLFLARVCGLGKAISINNDAFIMLVTLLLTVFTRHIGVPRPMGGLPIIESTNCNNTVPRYTPSLGYPAR